MKPPGVRRSDAFRLFAREVKFEGKVVTVAVEHIVLPNGFETHHEVIQLPSAVAVVPLLKTPEGKEDVLLVEQFRSSLRGYIHEIPAGIIEEGEDPAGCAVRELEEETGYVAGRLTPLASLCPIPGTSAHVTHFFLAEELSPGTQRLEAGECLSAKRVSLDELLASILAPEEARAAKGGGRKKWVVDSKTHLGILHVAMLRKGCGSAAGGMEGGGSR